MAEGGEGGGGGEGAVVATTGGETPGGYDHRKLHNYPLIKVPCTRFVLLNTLQYV